MKNIEKEILETEETLLKYEKEYKELLEAEKKNEKIIEELDNTTGVGVKEIFQQSKIIEASKIEIEKLSETLKKLLKAQQKAKELEEQSSNFDKLQKMNWFEGSPYILNKKITCSLCGSKFTAYVTKSKNRYYRCQGYKKKICNAKSIIAEKIENAVRTIFFDMLFSSITQKEPRIYEYWERWLFADTAKTIFDHLYAFSEVLPLSLESIKKIKEEFTHKISEFEEEVILYQNISTDMIKYLHWNKFTNEWLKSINFNTLTNEGELILKFGELAEEKKITFTL